MPQIAIVPPLDSLVSFKTENELEKDALEAFEKDELDTPVVRRLDTRTIALVSLVVALTALASWFGWQTWSARAVSLASPPVATTGTALFNSVPEGASIAIDGISRGTTPIRVSLAAGSHVVEITSGSVSRTLPITVEAGAVVSQYVELAVAPPTQGGRVEVGSEPPGAEVRIDGVLKGVTPLVVNDVAVGQRRIMVSEGDGVVTRTVNVTRGATSTVVVSITPAAVASGGWLAIDAPLEMEITEGGRLLGTTRSDRLMLPVGAHRIELSSVDLEFAIVRTVQISAGKTTNVPIPLPAGRLSVNAVPWADVFVDGSPVGTTPLGELSVPIGSHEVIFRHPQLGERRQTVIVKAQSPARIGIDLRK